MSGKLGLIPYPQIDPGGKLETNPLQKYHDQLDPLSKLTEQLWKPPAAPAVSVAQPPREAMRLTSLGQQAMAPSPMTPPQGPELPPPPPPAPMAPPPAPPASPAAPPEMPPAPPPTPAGGPPPGSAMLAGAAPGGAPPPPPAGGEGPHDLTQFAVHPETGGLIRQRGAKARRLAAQTMAGPVFGGGSAALAQAGRAATPGGPPLPGADATTSSRPVQSRDDLRISQRIPSGPAQQKADIDAHKTADLNIGLESLKRAPEALAKNAQLIKNYPGFEHLRTNDPDRIVDHFIRWQKDNIKWLYKRMQQDLGEHIVDRSTQWYEGANRIAHSLAEKYGVEPHQAAAVLAALSPQKDWYQNVDLAHRVFEAHQLGDNWKLTPEMHKYAEGYIRSLEQAAEKQKGKALAKGEEPKDDPKQIPELRRLFEKFKTTPMSQLTDPHERAVFARWHDEAHNPRDYKIVTPEGDFGDTSMTPAKYTKKGKLSAPAAQRKVGWGSFNEIAKAMAALQTTDKATISQLMGGNHKVRNFYNNIIAPNNTTHGDITNDTHAIAAAFFRPLSGKALEVGHGLGTTVGKGRPGAANSATIGNRGMYGMQAEAYRRAAAELAEELNKNILPRQLQSVTWEGIRGLFSPAQKRDPEFVKHIENIWQNKGAFRGMTPDERREAIVKHAGGLKLPTWAGGEDHGDDEDD